MAKKKSSTRTRVVTKIKRAASKGRSGKMGFMKFTKSKPVMDSLSGIGGGVVLREIVGPALGENPQINILLRAAGGYAAGGGTGLVASVVAPYVLRPVGMAIRSGVSGISGQLGGGGGLQLGGVNGGA